MTTLLMAAALAAAQTLSTFSTFTGSIVDPQGAVLPGARVAMSNADRQSRYEVASDRNGHFELTGLTPGSYQLEAHVPGFRPFRSTIEITSSRVERRIVMQIGGLQETITITESNGSGPAPTRTLGAGSAIAEARPNPPCAAPSAGDGVAIGGNLRAPKKIRDVKPDYPASLRGSGTDAVVVVDGVIGLDGFIKDLRAHEPAEAHAAFVDALTAAVLEWRFDSTLLNCVPVEVPITITGTFTHRP